MLIMVLFLSLVKAKPVYLGKIVDRSKNVEPIHFYVERNSNDAANDLSCQGYVSMHDNKSFQKLIASYTDESDESDVAEQISEVSFWSQVQCIEDISLVLETILSLREDVFGPFAEDQKDISNRCGGKRKQFLRSIAETDYIDGSFYAGFALKMTKCPGEEHNCYCQVGVRINQNYDDDYYIYNARDVDKFLQLLNDGLLYHMKSRRNRPTIRTIMATSYEKDKIVFPRKERPRPHLSALKYIEKLEQKRQEKMEQKRQEKTENEPLQNPWDK